MAPTDSSGCTASSSAGPQSHAASSTSTGPSTYASPNHVHEQRQFIVSFTLAIVMEQKQMPLRGSMGAPVFRAVDIANFIDPYECLSSCTRTDLAVDDFIPMFLSYCSEMIQETIKMINGYLWQDWERIQ